METPSPLLLAVLLCVAAAGTSGIPLPDDAQQLPTDSFPLSELTLSVLVNQMMLVKMLNDSSRACSLHEAALAESAARHEAMKEELRRTLAMALTELEEKKEEMLHELTKKKEDSESAIALLREQAVDELTETKQRIKEELNATIQATLSKKTFRFYGNRAIHSAAMDACRRNGGRLAVPENNEESAQLFSLVKMHHTGSYALYWIGVDDKDEEGVWVNSHTGLPLIYKNFAGGEPNNAGWGGQHCGTVRSSSGKWDDDSCSGVSWGYLCEFNVL